ncbi:helix-turn-helix transcriptional regulator [Gordonia sp. DT219]|uniref:helix-turn-helix transcriptional regulator n=1 Tax=Gordonia sp. DT219 TaxID=3416658 RepID=UPI003CF62E3F
MENCRAGCDGPLAPLAVLILGLVAERPMHPYEMAQTAMERREDRLVKFRPGTLYHTVDRLAGNGLIEVYDVRREGNRPERTVYAITATGRGALVANIEQILQRHPTEYPDLYLALSEAHALPLQRVIELLSVRIEAMRAELSDIVEADADARARGIPEMFYLDAGCRIVTLRSQIDWLAEFLDRLSEGGVEWLDDPGSRWAAMQHSFSTPAPESPAAPAIEPSTARSSQRVIRK